LNGVIIGFVCSYGGDGAGGGGTKVSYIIGWDILLANYEMANYEKYSNQNIGSRVGVEQECKGKKYPSRWAPDVSSVNCFHNILPQRQ
jgi:hypothetical protein